MNLQFKYKKNLQLLILLFFFSIILIILRRRWMVLWLSLEINTLAFLIISSNDKIEFEFKYFFIQSVGSIFFLIRLILGKTYQELMIFLSIRIKLVIVPFFFWIYNSIELIGENLFFLFITFQKIGPLWILQNLFFFLFSRVFLYILYFVLNLIFSIFYGLKYIKLKKILFFLSINQTALICLFIMFKNFVAMLYIINYFLSLILLLIYRKNKNSFLILFFLITGFPPSSLFILKLMLVKSIIINFNMVLILLIVFFNIIFLVYLYTKIFLYFYLTKKEIKKSIFKQFSNHNMIYFLFLTLNCLFIF